MTSVDPDLATLLSTCHTSRPWAEQDEGPYHRGASPVRRDLTEDRDGIPLQLGLAFDLHDGRPAAHVTAEIWHCDALGRYSGFPPPDDDTVVSADTAPTAEYLANQSFLRGRQNTDAEGLVEFHTIYPGWYPGRTIHIHLTVNDGETTHTSQLYFPDEINDEVLATTPYDRRPGRDTANGTDEIFPTGGDPALMQLVADGAGYRAALRLVLPANQR